MPTKETPRAGPQRLAPVMPQTCDTCGKPIRKDTDGWVEWLRGERGNHGFRVCHHVTVSACAAYTDNRQVGDMHLNVVNLAFLLGILRDGVADVDEWIRLVARLLQPENWQKLFYPPDR